MALVKKDLQYDRDPLRTNITCFRSVAGDGVNCFWARDADNIYKLTGKVYYNPRSIEFGPNYAETNIDNVLDEKIDNTSALSKEKKKYYYKENIYYEVEKYSYGALAGMAAIPIEELNDLRDITIGTNANGGGHGVHPLTAIGNEFSNRNRTVLTSHYKSQEINMLDNSFVNNFLVRGFYNHQNRTSVKPEAFTSFSALKRPIDFENFRTFVRIGNEFKHLADPVDGYSPNIFLQLSDKNTGIEVVAKVPNGVVYWDSAFDIRAAYKINPLATTTILGDFNQRIVAQTLRDTDLQWLDLHYLWSTPNIIHATIKTTELVNLLTTVDSLGVRLCNYVRSFITEATRKETLVGAVKTFVQSLDEHSTQQIMTGNLIKPNAKANCTLWIATGVPDSFEAGGKNYNIEEFIGYFHMYHQFLFLLKVPAAHFGGPTTREGFVIASAGLAMFTEISTGYSTASTKIIALENFIKCCTFFNVVNVNAAIGLTLKHTASEDIISSHAIAEVFYKLTQIAGGYTKINLNNMVTLLENTFDLTNHIADANTTQYNANYTLDNSDDIILDIINNISDFSYSFGKYTYLFEGLLKLKTKGAVTILPANNYYYKQLVPKSRIIF